MSAIFLAVATLLLVICLEPFATGRVNFDADTISGYWINSRAASFNAGTGEELDPYIIIDAEQLALLSYMYTISGFSDTDKYFKLDADINLSNHWWNPIGNDYVFRGVFDGNNKTISGINLEISSSNSSYGLFARVGNTTLIKDINMSKVTIKNIEYLSSIKIGGLIGKVEQGNLTIKDINISEITINSTSSTTGGLIGDVSLSLNDNQLTIDNCNIINLEMEQTKYEIGGIIGRMQGCLNLTNSEIEGKITITNGYDGDSSGGIIGRCNSGDVFIRDVNCRINLNHLTGSASITGGFIGQVYCSDLLIMENCKYEGDINIEGVMPAVGGFVGFNANSTVVFESCSTTGNIITTVPEESRFIFNIAGFIGFAAESNISINSCTNNIDIEGSHYGDLEFPDPYDMPEGNLGGFIGYLGDGNITINHSINRGNIYCPYAKTGAGGLIGSHLLGILNIRNSYNTGDIVFGEVENAYIGGIIGGVFNPFASGNVNAVIENCYNTGSITTTESENSYLGGIIGGGNLGINLILENCYNIGDFNVGGSPNIYIGGIAGHLHANSDFQLTNYYNIGKLVKTDDTETTYLIYSFGKNDITDPDKLILENIYYLTDEGLSFFDGGSHGDEADVTIGDLLDPDELELLFSGQNWMIPEGGGTPTLKTIELVPCLSLVMNGGIYGGASNTVMIHLNYDEDITSYLAGFSSDFFYKDNYEFGGWYLDSEFEESNNYTNMPENDLTLYAKWIPNDNVVIFNANGGEGYISEITVDYEDTVTLPENNDQITRFGYTFKGWAITSDGEVEYEDGDTFVKQSEGYVVLYAVWTLNQYIITFDFQGGTGETEEIEAQYAHEMPAVTAPSKTGYTFDGYYTGINGTGAKYYNADMTSARNYDITTDITLYAKWTANIYTITFEINYTEGENPQTKEVTFGSAVGVLPSPVRTGYSFVGWVDSEEVQYTFETVYQTVDNLTLYAQWAPNQYNVSFDLGYSGGESIDDLTVVYNSAVGNLPIVQERTGYSFTGWENSLAVLYTSETIYQVAQDITLYAKWTANTYTITFEINYTEGENPSVKEATYNSIVGELPVVSRTGYTFGGWKDSNGTEYSSDTIYVLAENLTLTAFWVANGSTAYKVEHYKQVSGNQNFSLFETENETGTTDSEVAAVIKTYEGFVFDADNESNLLSANINADGSLVLKVYYKFIKYTYTFYNDDTVTVLKTATADWGSEITAPENPTKPSTAQYSYSFAGWDKEIPSAITEDITFTAVYNQTLRSYTITWDIEGVETNSSFNYDEMPQYSGETPTKDSTEEYRYEFIGWEPQISKVIENTTYTAKFKSITRTYTITFEMPNGTKIIKTYTYGETITLEAFPKPDLKLWEYAIYSVSDVTNINQNITVQITIGSYLPYIGIGIGGFMLLIGISIGLIIRVRKRKIIRKLR